MSVCKNNLSPDWESEINGVRDRWEKGRKRGVGTAKLPAPFSKFVGHKPPMKYEGWKKKQVREVRKTDHIYIHSHLIENPNAFVNDNHLSHLPLPAISIANEHTLHNINIYSWYRSNRAIKHLDKNGRTRNAIVMLSIQHDFSWSSLWLVRYLFTAKIILFFFTMLCPSDDASRGQRVRNSRSRVNLVCHAASYEA